jgi:hypothetical protein
LLPGQLHRLPAILCLADDLDPVLRVELRPKAGAHERLIVG